MYGFEYLTWVNNMGNYVSMQVFWQMLTPLPLSHF